MGQKYLVRLGDDEVTYEIEPGDGDVRVRREDGEWHRCELSRVGESDLYLLMLNNHPIELYMERRRAGADVTLGRHRFEADVRPWRPGAQRARQEGGRAGVVRVVAPMTGSIVDVRCQEGDRVERGQVILVIESMKMNNELRSPADGVVDVIGVTAGQRVKANELLLALRTGDE
jgi:biotin carboxyl carrier protein